jgi:hypothetical protein
MQVTATTDHITLSLKWFGRVVGGPLHRRVKLADVHWCLEGNEVGSKHGHAAARQWSAAFVTCKAACRVPPFPLLPLSSTQVHILLGKADPGSNWRGLFHGSLVSQRTVRENPKFKGELLSPLPPARAPSSGSARCSDSATVVESLQQYHSMVTSCRLGPCRHA